MSPPGVLRHIRIGLPKSHRRQETLRNRRPLIIRKLVRTIVGSLTKSNARTPCPGDCDLSLGPNRSGNRTVDGSTSTRRITTCTEPRRTGSQECVWKDGVARCQSGTGHHVGLDRFGLLMEGTLSDFRSSSLLQCCRLTLSSSCRATLWAARQLHATVGQFLDSTRQHPCPIYLLPLNVVLSLTSWACCFTIPISSGFR